MNEKMKKILMREAYVGAVALALFIVIFALCTIFPNVKEGVGKALSKNTDLEKVVSLCAKVVKEINPF